MGKMYKYRIDVFRKQGKSRAFFNSYDDAINYATNIAKRKSDANIFMLEKISDNKYGNIVQLHKNKEAKD